MNLLDTLLPLVLTPLATPPAPHCTLLASPASGVRTVAVAPGGRTVAAALADRSVWVLDLPASTARMPLKLTAPVSDLAFAPNARLASLANGLEVWDLLDGKRALALPEVTAYQLAYGPRGTLAVAGYRISLREPDTLKVTRTMAEGTGWLNTCVAFSGDGRLLGAGDTAGNLCVWDTATGARRLRRRGHDKRVTGIGFIDDGRTVVSASADGRLKFWDLALGHELGVLFPHGPGSNGPGISALACTPDGRMIATAGAGDGTIRLWEAATARPRATMRLRGASLTSLCLTHDGSALAAGGTRDGKGLVAAWTLYAPAPLPTRDPRPALWRELAGDSATAYRAMLRAAAQPRAAVAVLRQRLQPVKLDAAVCQECDTLIARLDHERFDTREQARQRLETLSPWVEPYIRQALAKAPTLELQRRLQKLLAAVHPATLPLVRAVEILEHLTAPEARELLRQLADGEPTARITQEARGALVRQSGSSTKDTKKHDEDRHAK